MQIEPESHLWYLTALRSSEQNFLDTALKKQLVELIDKTMSTKINYSQKQCKLENALQRQVYKLAGAIVEGKRYRGIRFKW